MACTVVRAPAARDKNSSDERDSAMSNPWDMTEAQRMQFREAHAEAKRKSIDELLHDPRPESETERERRAVAEHKCPHCHIAPLNRCRSDDGTLLEHPHPERVRLVKER